MLQGQVNDAPSQRVESPEDQSLWIMTKRVMGFPVSVFPWSPRGFVFSDPEKAEPLPDRLETQFKPVTDPSVPAVIGMFDVALRPYFPTPGSEP